MAFYNKNTEESKQEPKKPATAPETEPKEKVPAAHQILGEDKKEKSDLEKGATVNLLKDLEEGEEVKTILDKIYQIIENSDGKITTHKLSTETGLPLKKLKYFLKILNRGKVVEIYYPTNPLKSPVIKKTGKNISVFDFKEKDLGEEKKLLETYTVLSDYVVADIKIWSIPFENTAIYQVVPHKLSTGSQALVIELMEILVKKIPVKLEDITDPRKVLELKEKFFDIAVEEIKKVLPEADDKRIKVLAGVLLHQSYGLGDLEIIMADNWLEEVAVNGAKEPVSVYHRRFGWLKTTTKFGSETEVYNFASQIGRKVGKEINSLNPIMDAHLLTGDRVASTLFPISTGGNTLTIRRFARNPWTIVNMVDPNNHTMSKEMMAFLWLAIQYELNVLVVGGTASGKTSVLNTLSSVIQPTNRIITIEDTREISLPDALHWNWVPLNSRTANPEGLGEVTMLDLMVASLRMRPDRIIVGEIRRKAQAEAMFEAMHTGHSVYATMHADTAEQTRRRLTQPPIEIPENETQALHLVVVQYRDRRKGIRRTLEIAEILPGAQGSGIKMNYLYRWRPRRDKFDKDNSSIRVIEDLNLHTGLTTKDIKNNLEEKENVLQWMIDNNIKDINKVGQIMRIYYKYPKLLIDTVLDGSKGSNLLK